MTRFELTTRSGLTSEPTHSSDSELVARMGLAAPTMIYLTVRRIEHTCATTVPEKLIDSWETDGDIDGWVDFFERQSVREAPDRVGHENGA